ncbi:S41 family peptidase [Pedobacter nototheniae]|uniref:S41 family peptidase n=1 Tax=Pedobacter nototheniae TaxID=2488994 RepID=UPI002931477D|nr:S41 family peptidase [Pedobacter nototheniae]
MNKYLLMLLLLLSSFNLMAQEPMADSVKNFLDSSLNIIQKHALNSKKVNWEILRSQIYHKASGAKTYEDILPLYRYIFEQIDDHHGSLKFKGKTYGWNGKTPIIASEAIKKASKQYKEVRSEKIGSAIGYLLVPGNSDFRGQLMDSISKSIKNAIAKVNDKNIKGWIIDLRVNDGGNMYPMIAGLTDFIGEGKVGGFINADNVPQGTWIIKDGTFYVDSIKVTNVKYEGYPLKKDIPIAVLIAGYTASSGEMTAISTIGRKKSILIGENSAGYTTTNLGFEINKDAGLNLAVDYPVDRNGEIYPVNLKPAILVEGGDNFEKLTEDKKITEAIKWLKKNR